MKNLSQIFSGINNIPSKAKALGAGVLFTAASILPFNKAVAQTVASSDNTYRETPAAVIKANTRTLTIDKKAEPVIISGDVGTAQDVSSRPSDEYIGVYMVVDKDYPKTADELIHGLKQYFDHYGLPVKFVKPENPDEGKYFSMRFYVGGESYRGNLSTGNVSMREIVENHEKVFTALRKMYIEKNPKIAMGQSLGMN